MFPSFIEIDNVLWPTTQIAYIQQATDEEAEQPYSISVFFIPATEEPPKQILFNTAEARDAIWDDLKSSLRTVLLVSEEPLPPPEEPEEPPPEEP